MNVKIAAAALAALVGAGSMHAARAQDAPAVPDRPHAEVMVLGMFHFASSGRDTINPTSGDIMGDRFQAEIEAIAEAFAEWKPTKVVLEATPDRQEEFDALYAAYLAGEHELTANERQQLGFRIAAKAGLSGLNLADSSADVDFPGLMTAMETAGQAELSGYIQAKMAEMQARFENPAEGERSIAERLLEHNDPAALDVDHSIYLDLAEAGDWENAKGADVIGDWWTRNMHIYANVARVAEEGDRILVIYGSGHAYTLRSFFEHSQRFTLVEPNPILETVTP